jgi:hypothetical protein
MIAHTASQSRFIQTIRDYVFYIAIKVEHVSSMEKLYIWLTKSVPRRAPVSILILGHHIQHVYLISARSAWRYSGTNQALSRLGSVCGLRRLAVSYSAAGKDF